MDPIGQNPDFFFSQEMAPEWSWKEASKQQVGPEKATQFFFDNLSVNRNSKQIMWQKNT